MPPKNKFTREQVIQTALELVRREGMDALTARGLAQELGCSVKPIFGLFHGMEEVQREVIAAAYGLYSRAIAEAMAAGEFPPYKASGMAYIDFARREKQLFRLLFMRDRRRETEPGPDDTGPLLDLIQRSSGMSRENAALFHMEMWIYVHGVAAMLATDFLDWNRALVSASMTDIYRGLLARYREKEATDESY